ncbi:MAG: EamA family transporter, partial [Halopseudomonas sp.]
MVIYLACSLLLLPLTNPLSVLELTGLQFWLLVACCLNTLIAYGAFAEALVHWEASRVSATIATTPLFTFSMVALGSMLWPSIVQPELLNNLAYLGALMVVVGSALVALAPSLIQKLKNRRLRRLAVTPPPAGS